MWIWELSRAGHGDVSTIVRTARLYGVGTLLIKSGDGTNLWSQFSSSLVRALHASGLKVCAWQYVYGNHPSGEADVGAAAVHDGADCLIIDAESEYEGKYVSAETYIQRLRSQVGANYPLALAGFPYVDYHPGFPYSVFLGPGGAQYNAPQMYWKDIGTTTDAVFAHTYAYNMIYGRPIFPLGQVYSRPPARQIFRFRQLSRVYGAAGVSWWDWQEATSSAWTALSRPAGLLAGYQPYKLMAPIKKGAKGDLVVWAQEHLISAGYRLGVDGGFGGNTRQAVLSFQRARGLAADGIVGPRDMVGAPALPARVHQVERARDDASRRHLRCGRHRDPLGAGALVSLPAGQAQRDPAAPRRRAPVEQGNRPWAIPRAQSRSWSRA